MADADRVVTASLPGDLVARLDEIAQRIDRSKSWIIRQALAEWLAEEQRRHELTLAAMKDIDEGRSYSHEEVMEHFAEQKRRRHEQSST